MVANYQIQFLDKIENMITSLGGAVPTVGETTNFEQRSIELLDSLQTVIGNISSPEPIEQSDLFGTAPADDSILRLNTSTDLYEHLALKGVSLRLPAEQLLGSGEHGLLVRLRGWQLNHDIAGDMAPDANGVITLPVAGRYLIGGYCRFLAHAPTTRTHHLIQYLQINSGAFVFGEDYAENAKVMLTAAGFSHLNTFEAGTQVAIAVSFNSSTGNYSTYTVSPPKVMSNAQLYCYLLP